MKSNLLILLTCICFSYVCSNIHDFSFNIRDVSELVKQQLSTQQQDNRYSETLSTSASQYKLNRHLSISVSTQTELSDAINNGDSLIEFTSDLVLTSVVNITTNNIRILGNNYSVIGKQIHKDVCFHIHKNVIGITFQNMTITQCGGNSYFYHEYGGALLVDMFSTMSIVNCRIHNNIASYGGGIFINFHASVVIRDTIISNNIGIYGGGGIFALEATAMIIQCSILNNFAYGVAAGILTYNSTGIIKSSDFEGNYALSEAGGVLFLESSSFVVENSVFTKNRANTYSGGVAVQSASHVEFIFCSITYNEVSIFGAGVGIGTFSSANFYQTSISHNIGLSGGGIAVSYGFVNITECMIENNTALSQLTFSVIEGDCVAANGCIYSGNYPNEYPNYDHCIFQSNADGILDVSVFYTEEFKDILTIEGVEYSGIKPPMCVNVSQGNNITWQADSLISLSGFAICLFELITGGGGIHIHGGTLSITNSSLLHNKATRVGGAVNLIDGNLVFIDSEIIDNTYEIMTPINFEGGTFYAQNLKLTGNIEGISAVTSTCNSACGPGRIGVCSIAGDYAPNCNINCECFDCPAGKYSDASGSSDDVCMDCPSSKYSYAGQRSCDIAASGYYIDQTDNSQECPNDATCEGGLDLPRPNSGYWVDRSKLNRATFIHGCIRDTCKGGTNNNSCWLSECYGDDEGCSGCDSDELQCLEGSEGPLCGSCSSGYSYSSSSSKCISCNLGKWTHSSNFQYFLIIFSLFIVIVGIVILAYVYGGSGGGDKPLIGEKTFWWIHLLRKGIKFAQHQNNSGVLRVLWVNYQIIASISWTLGMTFPLPFRSLLSSIQYITFDIGSITDCLPFDYLSSVLIWCFIPIGFAMMNYFICYLRQYLFILSFNSFIQKKKNKKNNSNNKLINQINDNDDDDDPTVDEEKSEKHKMKKENKKLEEEEENNKDDLSFKMKKIKIQHFSIFLWIFFIFLPITVQKQFLALDCFQLKNDSYLRADTAVDCNSSKFHLFVLFDIAAITIYMTIPLYWVILLYRQKDILNPPNADEQLAYYLRENDETVKPLQFLFSPYRPKTVYFESVDMFRRILFIGVLPLLSAQSETRALGGILLSLFCLELFKTIDPYKSILTNLLAYVGQYSIFLTFCAGLLLETDISTGLSDTALGVLLFAINISVLCVLLVSSSLRFIDEQAKEQRLADMQATKVEWACGFSNEKFKTTFDAITEHSVPPSSVLCFWYTGMISAQQALKSGIPATILPDGLCEVDSLGVEGGRGGRRGGVVLTLHGPFELDTFDEQYFPVREVVLACAIPKRWLLMISSGFVKHRNPTSKGKEVEMGVRVLTARSLQALRGNYFGEIHDPRPWYEGGVFLPPKAIRRAYQLKHQEKMNERNFFEADSTSTPIKDEYYKRNSNNFSVLTIPSASHSTLEIKRFNTLIEYSNAMTHIRQICYENGWVPIYHFTQPIFGPMIARTGLRMSTQGQGDGGVYFTTKGPCSYGFGIDDDYEKNMIIDCFGENRLEEYIGQNKLDLIVVYGALPQVLSPAPGGRDNAVMVKKSDFEALTYPHYDGNYLFRSDRILGLFYINNIKISNMNHSNIEIIKIQENEIFQDQKVKENIHFIYNYLCDNCENVPSKRYSKRYSQRLGHDKQEQQQDTDIMNNDRSGQYRSRLETFRQTLQKSRSSFLSSLTSTTTLEPISPTKIVQPNNLSSLHLEMKTFPTSTTASLLHDDLNDNDEQKEDIIGDDAEPQPAPPVGNPESPVLTHHNPMLPSGPLIL